MSELDEIKELVTNYNPKSIAAMIKRRSHLYKWLLENTPDDCELLTERVHIAIHGDNRFCPNGQRYKFTRGKYTLCGHQKTCECSKISTAQKVSATKSLKSNDEIKASNDRRKETNKQKYGVEYISQSEQYKERLKKNSLAKYGTTSPNRQHITPETEKILEDKELLQEYISSRSQKQCLSEMNIWYGTFNSYLKKHDLYNASKSYLETDMKKFLDSNNISYIQNDRTVIAPKEVDFYLKDYNIAIEMHGLYWHTLEHVDKNYHYNKYLAAQKAGLDLIQIFEDEWVLKENLVKSRLLYKMNRISPRIYARKCEIREVETKLANTFLDTHHIQGKTQSSFKYGLFNNEDLVALMTFGKKRLIMNSKSKENEYELIRYVTNGSNVVGGASRLFTHFTREHNPKFIISYSDNRWNNGKLYETLGMTFETETGPGYYYVVDDIRKHRFNYTKRKLVKEGFDSDKSEKEIMAERGYFQIWDCGSKKWTWKSD